MAHLVFFPLTVRAHIRPTLAFILNILKVHPSVVVTTIVSSYGASNYRAERELLDRSYLDSLDFQSRFRSIEVALPDQEAIPSPRAEAPAFSKALLKDGLLERLWRGQEGTGAYARTPCFVLADIFRVTVRNDVHALNKRLGQAPTPVWHMSSRFGFAMIRFALSEKEGGFAPSAEHRYEQYLAAGMEEREAIIKAFRHASGKLIKIPNMPPMYDYEFTPQTGARVLDKGLILLMTMIHKTFHDSDGIIDIGVPELDEECREYFRKATGVSNLGVGLQYSENAWELAAPAEEGKWSNAEDQRVLGFLDDAQRQHGPKSAIYVSLGTWMWPERRPEIIEVIIDTLLALHPPMPFVFSTAAAKEGQVNADLVAKVEKSGRGIITPWAPQIKILKHPATAVMLMQAGCRSLTEAILAGVPLIFLPFTSDQPANAMYFTKTHPIGITLYQLASGCDGEPRYDGPTIKSTPEAMREELTAAISAMRGAKGAEFRKRISEVRQLIQDSKAKGGARDAVMSLDRFFREK